MRNLLAKLVLKLVRRVPERVLVTGATFAAFAVVAIVSVWIDGMAPVPSPDSARPRFDDWNRVDEGER